MMAESATVTASSSVLTNPDNSTSSILIEYCSEVTPTTSELVVDRIIGDKMVKLDDKTELAIGKDFHFPNSELVHKHFTY